MYIVFSFKSTNKRASEIVLKNVLYPRNTNLVHCIYDVHRSVIHCKADLG